MKSLKPKISCGQDNISTKFLKQVSHGVANPLSILINKSLSEGTVPDILKIAKVIPIYKAKEKDILTNYRPISLLSSI